MLDTVDLHYLREARAAKVANRPTLEKSALETRTRELTVIQASDITLVVSEHERQVLAADAPGAKVEVVSNLHEIAGAGLPFAQRKDLVFVDGFRHPPNGDGVRWFVEAVLPLLRERLPEVVFHCIGSEPTAEIFAL